MKGDGPPKFEPVKLGQWRKEYEAMIRDAQAELKRIKANPDNYAKDLTDAAADLIANLSKQKPDDWEQRIADAKANPGAWDRTNPKPKTALLIEAWKQRIEDIRKAMQGRVS